MTHDPEKTVGKLLKALRTADPSWSLSSVSPWDNPFGRVWGAIAGYSHILPETRLLRLAAGLRRVLPGQVVFYRFLVEDSGSAA